MSSLFGGGSSKTTTKTVYPDWYEDLLKSEAATKYNLASLGYPTYQGPTVAGPTQLQQAASQNINDLAGNFGMNTASLPMGDLYSGPIVDQAWGQVPIDQRELYESLYGADGYFGRLAADLGYPLDGSFRNRSNPIQQIIQQIYSALPTTERTDSSERQGPDFGDRGGDFDAGNAAGDRGGFDNSGGQNFGGESNGPF